MSRVPRSPGLALLQVVAVVVSAILILVLVAPMPVQIRMLVAVVFVMCGPGTALLTAVGSRFAETVAIGLVIALGMAITVLLVQLIMWSGQFDPRTDLVLAAVVVIAVIGITWWRGRSSKLGRAEDAPPIADAARTDGAGAGDHDQPMSVGEGG